MNIFERLKAINPQLLRRLKIIGLGLASIGSAIVITQMILLMAQVNKRCHSVQASAVSIPNQIAASHE